MSEEVDNFLEHYGVKGMKWGVRRYSVRKRKSAPRPSDEGAASRKILSKQKKFGTVALTNHELRVVNARIKLEQEFHKLNPKPKSKLDKGNDFAKKLIGYGTTAVSAYELYKKPATQAAISKGKKVMTAKP